MGTGWTPHVVDVAATRNGAREMGLWRTALALVAGFSIMDTARRHCAFVARVAPGPVADRDRRLARDDLSWRHRPLRELISRYRQGGTVSWSCDPRAAVTAASFRNNMVERPQPEPPSETEACERHTHVNSRMSLCRPLPPPPAGARLRRPAGRSPGADRCLSSCRPRSSFQSRPGRRRG